ncbi:MAG: PAS domain S-box protein [Rubrivivax sp.]|nr:MAG: PAS domain S-box protein [Rubrivivax sp.]
MKASPSPTDEPTRRLWALRDRREGWRLYVAVLAPWLIVIGLLAMLAITSVNVLGALRAYVGGESLWSKARSDAVQHLRDFAATQDKADYEAFEVALELPLGDQVAREEMLRENFSQDMVRDGLVAGGNHPDDIDGMITLFRRFGDQPFMQEALAAWTHGDDLLAQLRSVGRRLHEHLISGGTTADVPALLQEVRTLNDELVLTEKRFSASLAEVSRLTEKILVGTTVSATLLLSLIGLFLVRSSLKRQADHRRAMVLANERWELAAAAAELGLFELDIRSDVFRLDAKAAALFGWGPGEVVVPRTRLRQLIVEDDRHPVRDAFVAAVQSGQVFTATYRIYRQDGAMRYLESTGHVVDGQSSKDPRMVGVVRDITEAQAQAQRAMQRDAAEKVAQSQRDFLSRLSHELRTPLNAILGFAQLLLLDRTQALAPTQAERVNLMLNAGRQLLAMVEDVLDLSKVDAGEITIAVQPVALAPLWRASVAMVDGVRERHQVTLVDRLSAEPQWVCADPQRLMQVFINLLTNACKYNRPGGHVVVESWDEEDAVVIQVSDDGIGMSVEEVAQLFQPFKRLAPMAESIEGTGLGLYIVKQLVERMAGRIEVSSQAGQGSRFTLRLPTARPPSPDASPKES